MAQRTNTVYYFRGTVSELNESGNFLSFGIGINSQSYGTSAEPAPFYIAENTASFSSAMIEWFYKDAGSSTGITDPQIHFKMRDGAGSYPSIYKNTWQPAASMSLDTGDHQSAHIIQGGVNVDSSFTLHGFLNTSYSFGSNVPYYITASYGSNTNTSGFCSKLITTYEYDDSNLVWATKTVRIPIESDDDRLSASFVLNGGTGAIPALDSYLPEVSKSYKEIALELMCNDCGANATSFDASLRIDAAGETFIFSTLSKILNTANYWYAVYKFNTASFNTTIPHDLYLKSSTTNRFSNTCGILNVTYTYKASESTIIMNSCMYNMTDASQNGIRNLSSLYHTQSYATKFLISEPAPITVKHVGTVLYTKYAVSTALSIGVTSDSGSTTPSNYYTITAGSVQAGDGVLITVPPTSSFGNWGRGYNTIQTRLVNMGGNPIAVVGYHIVNYTSRKSTQGVGAHQHTIEHLLTSQQNALHSYAAEQFPETYIIPESDYYINSAFIKAFNRSSETKGSGRLYVSDRSHSMSYGVNSMPIYDSQYYETDGEAGNRFDIISLDAGINRYPYKYNVSKLNLNTTNTYIYDFAGSTTQIGTKMFVTYGSITFPVSGTITNYTGNGQVPIDIFDYETKEHLYSSTASSGGIFNTKWIDSTRNLIVIANNSGSLKGSNIIPAGSSSFSIDFSTGTAESSEHSFTFIG